MHPNWDNNYLQFVRLISEIGGVQLTKKQVKSLAVSMDLSVDDVNELFDRAHIEWERAKYGYYNVRKYTPRKELLEQQSSPSA